MIRGCLLVFLIVSFSLATAQTKINGRVMEKESGNGLPGVNVIVKEKNDAGMLSYASTDESGAYQLTFKSVADSVIIAIAGFNVKKQTKTILNKSQMVDFIVNSETIQLKEIKIKPQNIYQINDTLSYNVVGFTDKNDRTIGDVLKKMPGIVVNEDGSITYNNKPITKFYIEDRDLLQGRYGIATNNIEAKDVATVQVLENHQPIKALEGREFTDAGAINLKLKDSAKGVLVVTGQLGIGPSPFLWNNELFSMLFNKAKQSLNTYKGNNSGKDAAADLKGFYSGQENIETGNTLSVQSPMPPPITRERYLFNRSNSISTNNLWTFGKDYQVNANINYLNDRQEKSSYSRSVYYLPTDSLLTIEESLDATEYINLLNVGIQLSTNRKQYYLDNALNVTGGWNTEEGNLDNTANIAQNLSKSLFTLANTFTLIKNFRKINFNIQSFNGYSSSPHVLKIQPFLYGNLFQTNAKLDLMRQTLIQNHFSSSSKMTLGLGNGALKQNYTVGINLSLQRLHSDLQTRFATGDYNNAPDSLRNQLQWNKYQLFFSSGYTYSKNKLKATAGLPLVYNYLNARDTLYGRADRNNSRLFFNPTLRLIYELNLFWNLSASASFDNKLGEIKNGFTGFIMQSYRSIVKNEGQLPEQNTKMYSLDLRYRHPLHAIFLNVGTSYSKVERNLLYGYDFQGILTLRQTYEIPNLNGTYLLYARLSKGLDAIASTATLDIDYRNSVGTQISQGRTIDFINDGYRLNPGISSRIGEWASLSNSFQYMKSRNGIINDNSNFTTIHSTILRAQLNVFPAKALIINLGYENFYNSAVILGNRNINFADAGIKYVFRKLEFNLTYSNIFNAKQFVSAMYNDTDTFYSSYELRPAQVLLKVRFKIK